MPDRLFDDAPPSDTSDDYYTPRHVFDRMAITFDLDVCAPPGGIAWVPAAQSFSLVDDGLSQPWTGRVWMNPPYSDPAPWVDRLIAHGNGVALVPVTNGAWFTRLWSCADAVALLPRLRFVNGDRRGNPYRIVAAAFGTDCVTAVRRLGVTRTLLHADLETGQSDA